MRRWIRRRKLPDELICRIDRSIDVILFNSCAVSQIRRCGSDWRLRATTFTRIRRFDDRWDWRCCCLNYSRFRMYRIRMILPFPQFATDKPNGNHSPIAPDHFSFLFQSQVQLRELRFNGFRTFGINFEAVYVPRFSNGISRTLVPASEEKYKPNAETKRPERVCILREINITIFSLWQFAFYQSIVSLSLSLVVLFI